MRQAYVLLLLLASGACNQSSDGAKLSPYIATAVGRIDSATEARRLVSEVDGVVESVPVKRGQRVATGQILATIACAPRDAAVTVARSAAVEAKAKAAIVREGARSQEIEGAASELRAAQAELRDRSQQNQQALALQGRGFMSRREADSRANLLATAEAKLAQSEARLRLLQSGSRRSEVAAADAAHQMANAELVRARALLEQCQVRSPVSGRVLAILKREGEATGASSAEPLLIVGEADQLIVRAEIDERDAVAVRVGQRATIWTSGQRRWHGRVRELAGVVGRRTARSLDPTDRFDRDVREAFITIDGPLPPSLIGLRVTVGFER